ncbi:MAG: ROK family protein [Myxococcota bacterium]
MTRVAGFDIGGTHARLVVYDDDWEALARERRRTRDILEPEELAELMRDMLDAVGDEPIDAIGVGMAAQLEADGRVIANAPNFGWTDVAFAETLADALDDAAGAAPSIHIVNDLSALLWGEFHAGAARGHRHTLAVYIGTGVGGAILADGELVDGAGGKGGEIGHVKVAPGGRLCGCGQRGCVEAYAGGAHLERQVLDVATELGLDELRGGDVDLSEAEELLEDVPELEDIWERATDYLAVSLANAITLLNPGALLIGGGVFENLDDFARRVLTKTTPLISASARDDLEIITPELGDDAGVLGAALLASRR